MILVCIPGYEKLETSGGNSGGAGYVDGVMSKVKEEKFLNPKDNPLAIYWSSDGAFFKNCGVYGKALRLANPQEIEAYDKGIRNIYHMEKKFTISYVSDNTTEKIDIYNTSQENAVKVLDKMLSTDNKKLDGINYILEE